ncbi:hypothetical protein [Pseudomonas fortuita]|uniref:hypothetical protein n=1 Tax=Pseudomonas fortuita TaxID=3233375 RepID=UPI003C2C60C9
MSLETEIAGLSSKVTALIDYFTTAKTAIAKAVADAVAAGPEISRTFYVNQLIGDDNGTGKSDSPLKTIDRAIAATPAGGMVDIILAENYTLASTVTVGSRRVMIRGEIEGSTTRKLILNEFLAYNGLKRFGGFQVTRGCSMDFGDMTLSLPDSAGGMSVGMDSYYSLIFAGGSRLPGFMQVKLYSIAFELRGTFTGKIVGAGFPSLALTVSASTIPAALEGSLIAGVSAGKDPNTIPNLLTNITKL